MPNNFGLVPVDKFKFDKSKQPLLTGDHLCTATISSLKLTSDQSFVKCGHVFVSVDKCFLYVDP